MRVRSAELAATVADPARLPRAGPPEAFLGRSNVGKSSLLNALFGRRGLARTSRTPGKTRLLHLYRVERGKRAVLLVDLPGYGYARVSKAERERWRGLVEGYLEGRRPLRAAVLLQDLRRDVSEEELELVAWLQEHGLPVLVALTKADKLKRGARAARARELAGTFELPPERVVATSARTGEGVRDLWRAIDTLA